MALVVAVANQKGGVGKTFLVFHLAHYLSEQGFQVLAVDLDPQGNLTLAFRLGAGEIGTGCPAAAIFEREELPIEKIKDNLFLTGADIQLARYEAASSGVGIYFKFKKSLGKRLSEIPFEVVLVDCPPSLGLFSLSAFVAADQVLVPLRAEVFSVSGLADLLNVVKEVAEDINPKLRVAGLVLNAVNPRTKVAKETLKALQENQELPILATIPASVKAEEALRSGTPLWAFDSEHKMAGHMREALKTITETLLEEV